MPNKRELLLNPLYAQDKLTVAEQVASVCTPGHGSILRQNHAVYVYKINTNVIYYYVLYITPRYTLHYRNCLSYNYIAVYHYVTMRRYEPVDIP